MQEGIMKFLLYIRDELHRDLKLFAAENKETMNATIEKAIEKYIYEEEGNEVEE